MKKFLFVFCAIALMLTCGCSNYNGGAGIKSTPVPESKVEKKESKGDNVVSNEKKTTITIEMESGGKMLLELYPDKAPATVKNFVDLAKKGFYDGLTFHRIISGFMIQGGDPDGTGMGGPGHSVVGEFAENGFKQNDIKHLRGVISMARSQAPDSAGSQFFIMHKDTPFLDGKYAAFGKIIEGIEEVDRIASVPTGANDKPNTPVKIKKITVEE